MNLRAIITDMKQKKISIFEMLNNYHKVNCCMNEMELSYLSSNDKKVTKYNALKKKITKVIEKLKKR